MHPLALFIFTFAGKPFNPILGETYQAEYSGGVRVYAEQISHHPPISSWQMMDDAGRVSGPILLSFRTQQCAVWRDVG